MSTNDIHGVTGGEFETLAADWKFLLANERDSGLLELMAQTFLVGAFQQSGAEVAMHFDGNTYDRSGWVLSAFVRLLVGFNTKTQ